MTSNKKDDTRQRERHKMTARQKQTVDKIISAAETHEPGPDQTEQTEKMVAQLEDRITESEDKRRRLAEALHASRDQYRQLSGGRSDEEKRALPFGYFVQYSQDGEGVQTAIIRHHGRLYEAKIDINSDHDNKPLKSGTLHYHRERTRSKKTVSCDMRAGELLLLNNELHVVEPRGFDLVCGCLGSVQQLLDDSRMLIKTYGDETILVTRAAPMQDARILSGDNVEYDPDSLFVYSLLPKSQVDRLTLEKVPDISYADIGGLEKELMQIRDAIELPHLYPEYFEEHKLIPPKGILLYGPPGCGKTLIAKAVANSLAHSMAKKSGGKGASYFLNVKGPELLNKYVGETEQAIRDLFARARNRAGHNTPVIIFFDEMDSMFRVRGSGVSSDMEATIVPQLLSELDGLQTLENVVVIGATNREDLIDPAILRPGRLDRKIRIPRPGKIAAREIFSKYLTADLPIAARHLEILGNSHAAVDWMITQAVEDLYMQKPENEWIEITYADGRRKRLYLSDLASGAIIANIVNRAKFAAVKARIQDGRKGIDMDDIFMAQRTEFEENEELPSNTNPAEWYRIIGKGGERVVRIRTLQGETKDSVSNAGPSTTVCAGSDLE